MSAPWEALLTVAGGSVLGALLIVLAGYVAKGVFDRGVERSAEAYRSLLAENLETHRALLGRAAEEQKSVLTQAAAFDTDLRVRRIPVYTELWKLTSRLPKWPRAERVTYGDLLAFSGELRDWYFAGGGMFLSRQSVGAYKQVQDELAGLLAGRSAEALAEPIATPDYDRIRGFCSALRTELTDDIVSRRAPPQLSVPA